MAAIVADYFEMLAKEIAGQPYNKSEHRRNLIRGSVKRSEGAVERKHQNISSVLAGLRLPWIQGYKPLPNAQGLLRSAVENYVLARGQDIDDIYTRLEVVPESIEQRRLPWQDVFRAAPEVIPDSEIKEEKSRVRLPRKWNHAARDEQNRKLGSSGESFVVEIEREKLTALGRADLAEKVEWVSAVYGDGLGFDVRSFESTGEELHIEVKTTNNAASSTPFLVSRNELEYSVEETRKIPTLPRL